VSAAGTAAGASASPPASPSDGALEGVAGRLRAVPDVHRRYDRREADSARLYGIGAPVLQRLLDLGMPHRGTGAGRRYDATDLENVGLALGCGPRWRVMRWWAATLAAHDVQGTGGYRVEVTAQCPSPGHPGPCLFGLSADLVEGLGAEGLDEPAPGRWVLDLPGVGPDAGPDVTGRRMLPPECGDLVAEAVRLRFHLLPSALATDVGFARETLLADCRLASRRLAALPGVGDVAARAVTGLFVAVPYPGTHDWVQVPTADGPLDADPFLLHALHGWGLLDPAQWPVDRSPAAVLRALPDDRYVRVLDGGLPAPSRLTAVRRSGTPGTATAAATGAATDQEGGA